MNLSRNLNLPHLDLTLSDFIIWQDGKRLRRIGFGKGLLAALSIYIMIVPVMILDLFLWQYQRIYFKLMGIPRIKRKQYVILDRYHLAGLTFFQKLDCLYCEYVNGVVAFAKSVANQTEIYSCAIKHRIKGEGQEHQQQFYPPEKFAQKASSRRGSYLTIIGQSCRNRPHHHQKKR